MTHSSRRGICPTCGVRMHCHGDRRLRCPQGHGTFRVHPRKRGRPRRRLLRTPTAVAFLRGRESIRGIAARLDRSIGATHERVRRRIVRIANAPVPTDRIPPDGPLICIADALWTTVAGERWTVSMVLLRAVHATEAVVALAHAEPGGEGAVSWHRATRRLPVEVRDRVVAATIDGKRGLRDALLIGCRRPGRNPIPLQRCTFHILAEFLRRIGKRETRQEPVFAGRAWMVGRRLLREPRMHQRNALETILRTIGAHARCPRRTCDAIRWFIRQIPDATVCYRVTHHRIPSTTATAEAACKQLRRILTRIRPTTPSALALAAETFLRMSRPIRCKSHRIN